MSSFTGLDKDKKSESDKLSTNKFIKLICLFKGFYVMTRCKKLTGGKIIALD